MSKYEYHMNGHKEAVFALAVQCFPHCTLHSLPQPLLCWGPNFACRPQAVLLECRLNFFPWMRLGVESRFAIVSDGAVASTWVYVGVLNPHAKKRRRGEKLEEH